MKKKTFLTTLSIAALAIVSGYGGIKAYQTQVDGLGLLTINDVEALADDSPEGDNNKITFIISAVLQLPQPRLKLLFLQNSSKEKQRLAPLLTSHY